MSIGILGLLAQLFGCTGAQPDYHLLPLGSTLPPVRCVSATIEDIQIRGLSSPAMTQPDTRAVARTVDGKTIWVDYNRSLENKRARREVGTTLHLLLDKEGQAAGVAPVCPPELLQPAEGKSPSGHER